MVCRHKQEGPTIPGEGEADWLRAGSSKLGHFLVQADPSCQKESQSREQFKLCTLIRSSNCAIESNGSRTEVTEEFRLRRFAARSLNATRE
jgi:hypothetical protein